MICWLPVRSHGRRALQNTWPQNPLEPETGILSRALRCDSPCLPPKSTEVTESNWNAIVRDYWWVIFHWDIRLNAQMVNVAPIKSPSHDPQTGIVKAPIWNDQWVNNLIKCKSATKAKIVAEIKI